MRLRKSEWTDVELRQLAALVAAGGSVFEPLLNSSATSVHVEIKRVP